MKAKLIVILLMCFLGIVSCTTKEERQVKKLEQFTERLQEKSQRYSDDDWQKAMREYEQIERSMENGKFTAEQRREIGKLKGKCLAAFAKHTIGDYSDQIQGITQEVEGVVDGIIEELGL